MPDYNIDTLVRDPDFQGRPWGERQAILKEADPAGYGKLDAKSQSNMLNDMKQQTWWKPAASGKAATPPVSAAPAPAVKQSWLAEHTPSRKTIAKYARPVLEGAGMVVGGIVGAAGGSAVPVLGTAAGGVAGTALGYGMGSQVADIIEGPSATQVRLPTDLTGLSEPKYRPRTAGEQVGSVVNKLSTGAQMEMGGQVVGKAAGGVANKLFAGRAKGVPLSDRRTRYKAAQEFAASQESTPAAAESNKLRQGQTDNLLNRLGTAVKPTPGQASGNYKSAALEQSMASKDPAFAEGLSYNDAALRQSATENLTGAVGKARELPRTPPRDVIGANIVKAIETAKEPVRATEKQLYSEVPDYPMPAENFITTADKLKATPMTKGAKKILFGHGGLMDYAKEVPHTVEGLQEIEKSIAGEISVANRAGDHNTVRILKQMKEAVAADFTALGEAADRGDIMVSNGKVIIPSRLQGEIASIDERIAAQQAVPGKPDTVTMAKEFPYPYMRQKGEAEKDFAARITKDYRKSFPDKTVPMEGGEATNPAIDGLTARRATLQATLDAAQPAEDVAKAYSAAKRYSKEEKFDRFYRGAVADVLKTGEQATGRQITNEQVPARFFTRQGSKDLGLSLMPVKGATDPVTGEVLTLPERLAAGKQAAAEQMMPHITEQLISKTVDANTGIMNVPRAMAYVRQNADVLHELGLTRSVQQVIKGQIPRAIEAELEAKGVDIVGNPAMTALQAGKMIRRLGPAVSKLYGEPAMTALRDYGQMMEILGRNKNVSYAKGSTTAEKLSGDIVKKVGENAASLIAVTGGHGWVFSAAKNLVKGMFEPALAMQRATMNKLLQEALTNPAAAEALMKIARSKPANVGAAVQKYLTPFIRQLAVTATQPQEQPDASTP